MPNTGPLGRLRILLVEDSALDAELVVDQLQGDGLDFEWRRVEDEDGLVEALEGWSPDLILSDLSLPGFSGHQALAIVRASSPRVPFVFVSGTIGEETAIEALREGAADYILKQNMARLAAAAERAVREARAEVERRRTEAEMLKAKRLESLALLTGGLGHDLRNVMQPLLIVPSMMRDHTDDPQLLRLAELVEDCARRGLDMVGSMLAFARGDGDARETIAMSDVLKGVELMLQGNLPRGVELVIRAAPEATLRANRTELQQCLLNLALNAIQAMPDGGRLALTAECARGNGNGNGNAETVLVTVSDTGVGMDEATRSRLFTPFFTTKSDGTGLGLHSCQRIVEAHGGWIEVDSSPGEGTRFLLHFPGQCGPSLEQPADLEGRGERLLVIDEEPARAVRVARLLEDSGYAVETAYDGASALQHIRGEDQPELVLVDAGLSLLSAVQTLGEIERRRAGAPVVVMHPRGETPERSDFPPDLELHLFERGDPEALLRLLRSALAVSGR
ncbi:MAG: response regulator [Lysobacteraceae bacterium]